VLRRSRAPKRALSPRGVTSLLAAGTGVSVANVYYCQPLLREMAQSFGVPDARAGAITTLTQIGTALGMLIFVPMGDLFERRQLAAWMCVASAIAGLATGTSPSFDALLVASFTLGVTNNIPHLLLPFAAQLAPEEERGRVVGTVIGGLLVGILLSRFIGGLMGGLLGWRSVYFMAATVMLGLGAALTTFLPRSRVEPERESVTDPTSLRLAALYSSMARLFRTESELKSAAFSGAALFAAFSAFWTTLVFLLSTPPYHYGAKAAGLFGLLAAASAAAAPLVGRAMDRSSPRAGVAVGAVLSLIAFGLLWRFGHSLAGLVVGVVLLDVGVQTGHVANQTRIYSKFPEAKSRANTVYMVNYFIGGAAGSALSSRAWALYAWPGVCAVGLLSAALACAFALGGRSPSRAV
jgi:predicted MFS family arabinose efflux permease